MNLTESFSENIRIMTEELRVEKSFDVIRRDLRAGECEISFFYIDGFVKDGVMQRIMQTLLSSKSLTGVDSVISTLPYIEVEVAAEREVIMSAVLSGQAAMLAEGFGARAILIDARTYPARQTAEPDSDRVMQGSHDGFVETLVINTALIRRRIRDTRLTMEHFNMGGASKTDVVMCYMSGVADEKNLAEIRKKLTAAAPKSLTLGFQSLAESLIRRGWYNPFPKIRTTERPDTAAAHLIEGSILVICDTSPQVMILPTSIFDYLQQTDDFYFPPLTGSYLRLVRLMILILSVVATPLWYLYLENAAILPDVFRFLIPEDPGALPILLQLILVEVALDGLKIASMNTPDMLSNSLSIVGALILGDFAIEVGWLCADVIFYMAFVAIANFAQQNNELGYALKFVRVVTLVLTALLGVWGFALGLVFAAFLVASNNTLLGKRYLYPLIPFDKKAFKRLIIREHKSDFFDTDKVQKPVYGKKNS